jgi:hypothetical protein
MNLLLDTLMFALILLLAARVWILENRIERMVEALEALALNTSCLYERLMELRTWQ